MTDEHEMRYRAGAVGLSALDGPPHWFCSCGGWRFEAKVVWNSKTGNNEAVARRSFERHKTT